MQTQSLILYLWAQDGNNSYWFHACHWMLIRIHVQSVSSYMTELKIYCLATQYIHHYHIIWQQGHIDYLLKGIYKPLMAMYVCVFHSKQVHKSSSIACTVPCAFSYVLTVLSWADVVVDENTIQRQPAQNGTLSSTHVLDHVNCGM